MAENTTFEGAMHRLEEIVRSLETGACGLDDSLSLFQEGIALVKFCNTKLETAEQQVKILSNGGNGDLVEENFEGVKP